MGRGLWSRRPRNLEFREFIPAGHHQGAIQCAYLPSRTVPGFCGGGGEMPGPPFEELHADVGARRTGRRSGLHESSICQPSYLIRISTVMPGASRTRRFENGPEKRPKGKSFLRNRFFMPLDSSPALEGAYACDQETLIPLSVSRSRLTPKHPLRNCRLTVSSRARDSQSYRRCTRIVAHGSRMSRCANVGGLWSAS
jgi:hypothetical protein